MLLYVFLFNKISSCDDDDDDDDGVSPDTGSQQLHTLLQKPPISECRSEKDDICLSNVVKSKS